MIYFYLFIPLTKKMPTPILYDKRFDWQTNQMEKYNLRKKVHLVIFWLS